MGSTEWQLRWLCMAVRSKIYTTEGERTALMWRDLYFGYEGNGLKFAAQTYFKKAPSELTDEEVVQLWTLAKSPNRFISNPREFERASTVDLNRWRAEAK